MPFFACSQPPFRKAFVTSPAIQGGILALWMGVAFLVRLHHLTLKPLWTDEFSTLVFGLGHSFQTIPLDQVISLDTLLAPVRVTADTTVMDAAHHLLTESNHPPLYFMLTRLWLSHFPTVDGYVSVVGARLLSVVFGVAAVPALYGLGWVAFRSPWVAQMAAALMAVSPFGVYLAQEARHYTLAVLWIIASLTCLVIALHALAQNRSIPIPVILAWVAVNGLGMATHYFFILTLLAEALVLLGGFIHRWRNQGRKAAQIGLGRIGIAIAGTIATLLIWLPFLLEIRQGDRLTQWIYADGWSTWDWIAPPLQTLASVVSMLFLLPVQGVRDAIAIAGAILIFALALSTAGVVYHHLRSLHSPASRVSVQGLLGFGLGAIAIFGLFTYGLGIDLAQVFRYHFVYFPAVLLLVAAGLAPLWAASPASARLPQPAGRAFVVGVLLLGLVGCLTVTHDLGYRKLHRPDWVVGEMAERSEVPVLVAIAHQTHGQTGRLMALAWEMRSPRHADTFPPAEFFLDHQRCSHNGEQNCNTPSPTLKQTLKTYPRPFDLWLINYEGQTNLKAQGCTYRTTRRTDGYKFQQYRCRHAA